MQTKQNFYTNNPLIHKNRRLGDSKSAWIRSFDCSHIQPLIICRGPIRKEAMDVFAEMDITHYGILLSEKDSIIYQNALAPELRTILNRNNVHRVPDYTGIDKEEREQRIQQIIQIAKEYNYNAIFAGYGFMAEDETMVKAMEDAGLNFIGPCSKTVHDAGLKDEAKRTALNVGVSVTPGIDNASALALVKRYPDTEALQKLVTDEELEVDTSLWQNPDLSLTDKADSILAAAYDKGIDLYTIEELGAQIRESVAEMYRQYPENRIRLKAISGGGGKGQRILKAPSSFEGELDSRISQAADKAPELVLEILNEVKTTGVGDNKNVLIELNIETTRHQEIQVIGNGQWTLALGGRDCSLQMHEQKLLEVSVTNEDLEQALIAAREAGREQEAAVLEQDIKTLQAMETEAERFAEAVGLDSVSTFECIVDRDSHFFMEMNTRIQVEHRVTELCYALKFTNPDDTDDYFEVKSLVEAMVLLAAHGERLPKPARTVRHMASLEARLNATNQALSPHAGGVIESWSDPTELEIRDDQGISVHNPDTDVFVKYTLAGAYDSNIALLLTIGNNRNESYTQLAEILRTTKLRGKDLCTNLEFHYGLVNWFIGENVNARPTTRFILPYITAVGLLKQEANSIDLTYAYQAITREHLASYQTNTDAEKAMQQILLRKELLLTRPIIRLVKEPHLLAGWLSLNKNNYVITNGKMEWTINPIIILRDTYHYVAMEYTPDSSSANQIWDHDNKILQDALAFYNTLEERLGITDFYELDAHLSEDKAPETLSDAQWLAVQAAHIGYQAGLQILKVLPYLAEKTAYFDLKVNDDLTITIPDKLMDPALQDAMKKVLVPPPTAKADEILAASGGMFYPREAPGMDKFVTAGDHFNAGDPLYIIEVMKMFNKVYAPFSGTIDKVLVEEDGVIIRKGQPLFKITPDERVIEESPEDIQARKRSCTDAFLERAI